MLQKGQIKLPRKRKKAYIKRHSRNDYLLSRIAIEVLNEDKSLKDNRFLKTYRPKTYW